MSGASRRTGDLPRGVRPVLAVFCVLTAAGFVALALRATRTAETFAWTIDPPLTAAFLGAGYGAGFVLSVLSLRSGRWSQVRVPFLTVLVFTVLTTAATFVHLDRMHVVTPGSGPFAVPAAWVWLVVYVVVPVAMLAVVARRPGPGRVGLRVPMPRALAVALVAEGLVLGAVGVVLWVAPSSAAAVWPWALTPLTARAVASWLVAFGVAAALAVRARDLVRLRVPAIAYTTFGLLELTVLAVHGPGTVDGGPLTAAYVALLVAVVLTGAAGLVLLRRAGVSGA
ncbi:hypothetical protein [Cellulomonas carbonis]|uniref:Uncharacterized protein n=1 Tax=Cellulomonas carbonis T26 TaxID=947969 RepID=A0A0A0BWY4_9CELL|nr:hypothetical protein [Cellulomonas carbonis]KGM12485.1 hypothetical protein N868_11895 [Cellulomonas carbonis T26]GGC15666.1 hypothetical protein GCM10010972_31190 [Cellulomonas carbonis]